MGNGKDNNKKNLWDILSVVGTIAIPLVGAWFTHSYNMQQTNLNKIKTLDTFMPYVKKNSDPNQQQAAIAAIAALGFSDIAIKIATLNPTEGAKNALERIKNTSDGKTKESVEKVLKDMNRSESITNATYQSWNGIWTFEFASSRGKYAGEMTLETGAYGAVKGEFSTKSGDISGKIDGTISENTQIMEGYWSNNKGQRGKIKFNLIANLNTVATKFSGNYSMYDAEPKKDSNLTWEAQKTN